MQEKMIEKTKEEKYLERIFYLLRAHDHISFTDKNAGFNQTEMQLLGEVVFAKKKGQRYISTQLAKLLGITRSAVSQIVNNLEKKGVVRRVADEVDKKIAYIEITDTFLEVYGVELRKTSKKVANMIERFGEERFNNLCSTLEEFFVVAEGVIQENE